MATIPNIFLIVMFAVIPVLAVVTSVILLCVFQSPLDTFGAALIPKIISVFTMTLAILIPMILPFDVINANSGGTLSDVLPYVWQGLFVFIAIFATLVIPFIIMFYESGGTDIPIWRQFLCAGISTALIFIIFSGVTVATYFLLGFAEIPVVKYSNIEFSNTLATAVASCTDCQTPDSTNLKVQMSFIVYLIAALSVVGWVFFLVLGGLGVSAFPLGFFREAVIGFRKRQKIDENQYRTIQREIAKQTTELIQLGVKVNDLFKGGFVASPANRKAMRDFQDAVKQVEEDFNLAKRNFEDGGGTIFIPIGLLIAGVLVTFVSIVWIVHIVIYLVVNPPLFGFLNVLFSVVDEYIFSGISWILYMFFAYYMIVCVVSGNSLIARNIPIFSVYPLKYRDTLANGFLVNTGIMLISALGTIQFLTTAFADWAVLSTVGVMFTVIVKNMIYVNFAFRYIHYVFFGFVALGFVISVIDILYNALRPKQPLEGLKKYLAK